MKGRNISLFVFLVSALLSCSRDLPESWKQTWNNPPAEDRPLKMVHCIGKPLDQIGGYLGWMRDTCGAGGVVISYGGDAYLKGEHGWDILTTSVKEAIDRDMRVWIYDEAGYPSLSAGGRVLEVDPTVEAQELCMDESLPENQRYFARNSYEYTHATNNYSCARRYPDPANPRAVEIFLDVTHQACKDHLGEYYDEVEAFFTDEPSFMSINLGQIPEKVRHSVPVRDPLDPDRKLLPTVVWTPGLDKDFSERWGEELVYASLFQGDTEEDKQMRQKFWTLVGEKWADNFMKPISDWCRNAGGKAVSSGHLLSEENVERYTPLYGNILQAARGFDLPGLDMLDSEPSTWNTASSRQWLITAIPTSAAYLNGQRLVMCEMSDHNQSTLGDAPVNVGQMMAAAGCQMAQGVTELTLYYGINYGAKFPYRTEKEYMRYCEYVGRLNSIIRSADVRKNVLYYCPLYDFQREYLPNSDELIDERNQSPAMQTMIHAFVNTGAALMQNQVPFAMADYLALEEASVRRGKLVFGDKVFDKVVIPGNVVLPEKTAELLSGVSDIVRTDENCDAASLRALLNEEVSFTPASENLTFGEFERDGKTIYVVVNNSYNSYSGVLSVSRRGQWNVLNPDGGEISTLKAVGGSLPVTLAPLETKIYVSR